MSHRKVDCRRLATWPGVRSSFQNRDMTVLTFSVPAPILEPLGTIEGGQPFMVTGQPTEVYQAANAVSGTIRQCRRLSDGGLTTFPSSQAVALVSIESAVIGPAV